MTTVEQRLTRLEAVYEHLATKADIADLRAELKADIGRGETRTANLQAEMHRMNATLIRWQVSLLAGTLVIGLGGITAIFRFLG